MMIDNHQRRNEIKTQEQFPTQKVGNFIYNGVYMYMIIYIYIPLLTKEMSCKKLEILGLMCLSTVLELSLLIFPMNEWMLCCR